MTDSQPPILAELRQMAASVNGIDQQVFYRLMLATMADIYEQVAIGKDHSHPEFEVYDAQLKTLDGRDWKVLIGSVIAGITAGVLAWFAPHK